MGRLKMEFVGMPMELISTDLSEDQEQRLREAFSDS
jgi:uncharacterized membrane protein